MSTFDISVDPGSSATGVCPWIKGKLVSTDIPTLRPPKEMHDHDQRVLWLAKRFRQFLTNMTCDGQHQIGRVAIENFETFHTKDNRVGKPKAKEDMMKCAAVAGALMAVAGEFTEDVKRYSKGQITKEQTGWLARSRGVTKGGKDALDAFQIGICAGFDRSRS